MANTEDFVFKKLEPFIIRPDNEEDGNNTSSQSESSSVSRLLNALSSLTGDEGHIKDGTSFSSTMPLLSAKLENIQPIARRIPSLAKKVKIEPGSEHTTDVHEELLAKLSQQTRVLKGQAAALLRANDSVIKHRSHKPSPTTTTTSKSTSSEDLRASISPVQPRGELERLKRELDAAKEQIAKQDQELHKTRVVHTMIDQVNPVPGHDQYKNPTFKTHNIRRDFIDDNKSDISESMSAYSRGINAWDSVSQVGVNPVMQQSIWSAAASKPWANRGMPAGLPPAMMPRQAVRSNNVITSPISPEHPHYFGTLGQFHLGNSSRPRTSGGRGRNNPWGANWTNQDPSGMIGMNAAQYQSMNGFANPQSFEARSVVASTLSAMAPEFTLNNHTGYAAANSSSHAYNQPMEPLNYRKLLDRSVSCNWKYIVDKIVCSNDQQASIFLQQKLKVGTAEQKFEIVAAIVAQAYPLMVNRFGNFLVQRCFEHGTPEQVIAIANAIRGNTLSLSMDAFGCHVVQKAFDAVPEEYKAIMVHELLRRIPETVIHRYACHVWQKLFELRWSDSPPQIMKYVNDALHGMWHEVALGETGSLVVQNIFENCLEEDKRPCVEEVLKSIDIVSHGQFGNWCIQHICEHGAPPDRGRAIDHVLRYATEYSMDQFASKVVEKCLKIGGTDFLERYLERVCEGRTDRPRIPLIDIASDQYGNYLIQYILTHANTQHREVVACHIRKHMVSLRGSKFGSRVGLLCCNPAYATRPGPAVTVSSGRFPGSNNAVSASAPGSGLATGNRYGSGQFH